MVSEARHSGSGDRPERDGGLTVMGKGKPPRARKAR